jgi:hypothetical protein
MQMGLKEGAYSMKRSIKITMSLLAFSFLCRFDLAYANASSCYQMYGDGANVDLKISFGEKVNVQSVGYNSDDLDHAKLPFLAKDDAFVDYRTFSVTGYDADPSDVIDGYTLGAFDITSNETVGLVDKTGKNIGILYVRKSDDVFQFPTIGVVIYGRSGTWTKCP